MLWRKIIENLWGKIEAKYYQKRIKVPEYYENWLRILCIIRNRLIELFDNIFNVFLKILSIAMPTKYIKKSKVLIILSLLLFSLSVFLLSHTVINKYFVLNVNTALILICFIGSILLLKWRYLGVWIITFWGAIQIIPILYKDQYFDMKWTLLQAINAQGLVLGEIWSRSWSMTGLETISSDVGCYVEYGPFTLGLGINFIGIIVVLLCIIILIQNNYFDSIKRYVLLTVFVLPTLMIPVGTYYYYKERIIKIDEMLHMLHSLSKDKIYDIKGDDVIRKAIEIVQIDNDKAIKRILFRNINGKDIEWVLGDFSVCRKVTKREWHQGQFVGQTSEYIYRIIQK